MPLRDAGGATVGAWAALGGSGMGNPAAGFSPGGMGGNTAPGMMDPAMMGGDMYGMQGMQGQQGIPGTERALLDENGGHRAALLVHLGLDDGPDGGPVLGDRLRVDEDGKERPALAEEDVLMIRHLEMLGRLLPEDLPGLAPPGPDAVVPATSITSPSIVTAKVSTGWVAGSWELPAAVGSLAVAVLAVRQEHRRLDLGGEREDLRLLGRAEVVVAQEVPGHDVPPEPPEPPEPS